MVEVATIVCLAAAHTFIPAQTIMPLVATEEQGQWGESMVCKVAKGWFCCRSSSYWPMYVPAL